MDSKHQRDFDRAFDLRFKVCMGAALACAPVFLSTLPWYLSTTSFSYGVHHSGHPVLWFMATVSGAGMFGGLFGVLLNFFYDISCNPRWQR